MPQVKIGFRAVLGNVDLAVLIWTHCAGIDIDVRVEFLSRHLKAARLEQTPEGCCRYALAEARNYAARYEYVFCHVTNPLLVAL